MTKDNGKRPRQLRLELDGMETPGKRAPVIRRNGDQVELVEMTWGLKPRRPNGRAVINLRAEGRRFPDHRCLLPASEFFLHDQTPSHSMWRITLADGDPFYLAGIWRPADDDWPECFAILTTATGRDLEGIKDRQMAVVLAPRRMDWLAHRVPEEELLRPLPSGVLKAARIS